MKKNILALILTLCIIIMMVGCERTLMNSPNDSSSSETSSEISSTLSSSTSIPSNISSEENPSKKKYREHLERQISNEKFGDIVDSLGKYTCRDLGITDEISEEINRLIQGNYAAYMYYFLGGSIDYDGYDKICEDISPVSIQYTLT